MAVTDENIDDETYATVKSSIDYVKIKVGMPSDVYGDDMKKCKAPTLVMAGQNDCLFPANLVIPRAKEIISNCTTYLLKEIGHLHKLSAEEEKMIIDFLN